MKLQYLLSALILLSSILLAQNTNSHTWQDGVAADKAKWEQYKQSAKQQWQDYIVRESKEWQGHLEEIQGKWNDPRVSTVHTWVGYGPRKDSRFAADFQRGELKIEILGPDHFTQDRLQQEAIAMLTALLEQRLYPDRKPLLKPQVDWDSKADPRNLIGPHSTFQPYSNPQGNSQQQLIVTLPFRNSHVRERAQRILPYAERYGKKHNIDPKLIMSVIHGESTFNPRAVSTFPMSGGRVGHAYGLMQLVPFYGGQEGYEWIGGKGQPTTDMLFDPEKNIEIGVAYLAKLKSHYFAQVRDEQSQEFVMIAAYNTGPGNVARAFLDRRDLTTAIGHINEYTPGGLYNHLLIHLPYRETRDYLKRVVELMQLY